MRAASIRFRRENYPFNNQMDVAYNVMQFPSNGWTYDVTENDDEMSYEDEQVPETAYVNVKIDPDENLETKYIHLIIDNE